MYFHAIEEPFDDDEGLVIRLFEGPIHIEEFHGFPESRRQLVLRRILGWFARPPARVRHDSAFGIIDGNGDAPGHHALGAETDAEVHDGFECESALLDEIGMLPLQLVQTEFQRRVRNRFFRYRFVSLRASARTGSDSAAVVGASAPYPKTRPPTCRRRGR